MYRRKLWLRPRLRTDEDQDKERATNPLELFFDLFYVVLIIELSHKLAKDISFTGVISFTLLFLAVWWVWIGSTYYHERFERNDLIERIFMFLKFIPVFGMAISIHAGTSQLAHIFAISYILSRSIILAQWFYGGWFNPVARPVTNRYVTGFSISLIIWTISIFIPAPYQFGLWFLGLIIELATPIFTLEHQKRLPKFSSTRLPERFSLYMLIAFGESIISVVQGTLNNAYISSTIFTTGVLGITIAFCLWWIYFDGIADQKFRPNIKLIFAWAYLHVPLALSTTAIGSSIYSILSAGTLTRSSYRLLFFSIATYLIISTLVESTLQHKEIDTGLTIRNWLLRIIAAIYLIILALSGVQLLTIPAMTLVVGILVIIILHGQSPIASR